MIIDFETHFITQACIDYLVKRQEAPNLIQEAKGAYTMYFTPDVSLFHTSSLMEELLSLNEKRLSIMDEAGVTIQVLSLTTINGIDSCPGDEDKSTDLAKEVNDQLYSAIQKHPDRFKGFACISPYQVKEGVKELERAISQLGFIGWLTHSNFGKNNYLDDKTYWPLLEAAEGLNIPVYLHPNVPIMREFGKYGFALGGSALGFEFDTALCLMRMILGGVFDAFPKLKIMLGHLGETMPFLMERLDHLYRIPELKSYRPDIQRIPSEVLRQNVYVTTSGRFFNPALRYIIEAMGEDRVLFASDYPMESLTEAVQFINESDLSNHTKEKIFSVNAKNLNFV
ncbi:5-carboxyvanillate decarboxylase [Legionella norrlandica]|uniref:5-carboxyvanillate decarboxylase n=1 Tax=Legionella norrlandica TaxID=1498499 RepID=A0A0A2SX00_9GAMM|nr:amidohydrolase family protein [Legionella norrlandica]KGP64261.1 5-carboxyvanillate decarboxylase [Legionella norrlandica]